MSKKDKDLIDKKQTYVPLMKFKKIFYNDVFLKPIVAKKMCFNESFRIQRLSKYMELKTDLRISGQLKKLRFQFRKKI